MAASAERLVASAQIGSWVNMMLYMANLDQHYRYFRQYTHDPWLFKGLAAIALLNDTQQTITTCFSVYDKTVTNWGNAATLDVRGWELVAFPVSLGIAGFTCQAYLAYRHWRFTSSIRLAIVTFGLVFAGLVMSAIGGWASLTMFDPLHVVPTSTLQVILLIWIVIECLADLVIAISLVIVLHKRGKQANAAHTDSLIRRISIIALQSGIGPTLLAFLTVIIYLTMSDTNHFFGFYLVLSRVYSLTLLANLNMRKVSGGFGSAHTGSSSHGTNSHVSNVKRRTFVTSRGALYPHGLGAETFILQEEDIPGRSLGQTAAIPLQNKPDNPQIRVDFDVQKAESVSKTHTAKLV